MHEPQSPGGLAPDQGLVFRTEAGLGYFLEAG